MSVMSFDPTRMTVAAPPTQPPTGRALLSPTRALVQDVLQGVAGADRKLVERFRVHVHRLLVRMLGPGGASSRHSDDLDDLLQEVFFRVFQRLDKVDPPEALPGYVTSVAVLVARETIRKRRRARWLSFFSSSDLAEMAPAAPDIPDEVRSFYEIVGRLKEQSQLYVTLRYVEGMRLEELATAMEVSLATAKRHLQKAEMEFTALLGTDDEAHVVAPWLRRNGGVAR